MQLQLHYTNYTTPQLQLHYTTANYNYSCATPHYIQQLWVRWPTRWPQQPLQPLQKTQLQPSFSHPWFTTTNLSYRIPRFLFLKLPPPPCAVLLVGFSIYKPSILGPYDEGSMQGRCPNGYDGVLSESLPQVTWPEIRTLIERVVSDAEANAARLLRTFHVTILRGSGSFLVDWLAIGGPCRGCDYGIYGGMGVPPSHPSHGWPWLSIDTYGDLGISVLRTSADGMDMERWGDIHCIFSGFLTGWKRSKIYHRFKVDPHWAHWWEESMSMGVSWCSRNKNGNKYQKLQHLLDMFVPLFCFVLPY